MLQYYLRAEGLALSWVGTGPLHLQPQLHARPTFEAVADRFVAAARAMQRDGFWWSDAALTNKSIKRRHPAGDARHRFRLCSRDALNLKPVARRAAQAGSTDLAAQQGQRRLVVQHDVVERVRQDLREPHQARSSTPRNEEQVARCGTAARRAARPIQSLRQVLEVLAEVVQGVENRPNIVGEK